MGVQLRGMVAKPNEICALTQQTVAMSVGSTQVRLHAVEEPLDPKCKTGNHHNSR